MHNDMKSKMMKKTHSIRGGEIVSSSNMMNTVKGGEMMGSMMGKKGKMMKKEEMMMKGMK